MVLLDSPSPSEAEGRRTPGWREDIQGLRGVAVLLVVLFHAGGRASGGYVGVDVFFVISGFVITRLLLSELKATNKVNLKNFYVRRVRRLLPALALMIAVVMVADLAVGPIGTQQSVSRTGIAALLLSANAYTFAARSNYFAESADLNALLHTWSLSVEEQFYLAFPTLLVLAWAFGARRGAASRHKVATLAISAIAFLSFMLAQFFLSGELSSVLSQYVAIDFAFYSSPTRAWEFAAGALVALWLRGSRLPSRWLREAAAVAGLLLIAWAAFRFDGNTLFPGVAALVPVGGSMLLLASGEGGGTRTSVLLSNRVLVWLGALSYAWYLWHWPAIVFGRAVWPDFEWIDELAAVGSIVPAWVSWHFVENPIRSRGSDGKRRTVVVVVTSIAGVLAAGLILEGGHLAFRRKPNIAELYEGLRLHADVRLGCSNATPIGERSAPECTWTVQGSDLQAVLLGDSIAGQFTEPFVRAANEAGYSATVATMNGCPFVDVVVLRNGIAESGCRNFFVSSLRELERTAPALVVISSATDSYPNRSEIDLALPGSESVADRTMEKYEYLSIGIREVVTRLEEAGSDVLFIHQIPDFDPWQPRACPAFRMLRAPRACAVSAPSSRMAYLRRHSLAAERAALDGTGAAGLDVLDDVCPVGTCMTYRSGGWWWRDGTHLSVDGALVTTPSLLQAIESVSERRPN